MDFQQSETVAELAEALSKAQAEVMKAHQDKNNPFFKSKYADLTSVWDAIRAPLTKNGLSVIQAPIGDGYLLTQLNHKSGQWIRSFYLLRSKDDLDPQKKGSAITYARRYALAAMIGVCPEDDDANLASQSSKGVKQDKKVPNYNDPYGYKDLTVKDIRYLFTVAKEKGWSEEHIKTAIKVHFDVTSTKQLDRDQLKTLIEAIKKNTPEEALKEV